MKMFILILYFDAYIINNVLIKISIHSVINAENKEFFSNKNIVFLLRATQKSPDD
jgi:hypothetical protein